MLHEQGIDRERYGERNIETTELVTHRGQEILRRRAKENARPSLEDKQLFKRNKTCGRTTIEM